MLGKFSIVLLFVFSNYFRENSALKSEGSESSKCVFSSKPVPYATHSPINVVSKKTIKANVSSPVVLENGLLTPLTVINTGYALEAHGFPFERKLVQTFGGVLCGKKYTFYKVVFYVSDDPKISSFTQIDGKGSPLTLSIIYYNEEYGSFNESLYRRDGLVIENFQIGFSLLDNVLFYPVELLLYFLREPGTQVTLPAALVYAWFDRLPVLNEYYANYGSYIDLETGKQYPCAISLLAARTVFTLSESQFYASFPKLRNAKGGKLINRQPIRRRGKRPIYRADGLNGIFFIF